MYDALYIWWDFPGLPLEVGKGLEVRLVQVFISPLSLIHYENLPCLFYVRQEVVTFLLPAPGHTTRPQPLATGYSLWLKVSIDRYACS